MRIRLAFVLAPVVLLLLPGVAAQAQSETGRIYRFAATTNNDPENAAAGEQQLWVRVFPQSNMPDFVEMRFFAKWPDSPYVPLAITEVVIHDAIGLFDYAVVNDFPSLAPVDFELILDPATPRLFTFRSNPEDPVHWGVGPEDTFPLDLSIRYHPGLSLNGLSGMDLVFAALEDDHNVGAIPVTLKVEGFADGGTESFQLVDEELGSGPIPGPEPAAGGPAAALATLAMLRRRRARAAASR